MPPLLSAIQRVDEIFGLLASTGGEQYFGEQVTKLAHSEQCAWLAQQAGADEELVLAALLHDIGHLLEDRPGAVRDNRVGVVNHDAIGAEWLAERGFSSRLCALVRGHVDAKRYLTAVHPQYLERLSPASTQTLQLQGGPFEAKQAACFVARPESRDILRLRTWDEMAKDPAWAGPSFETYRNALLRHLSPPSLQQQFGSIDIYLFDQILRGNISSGMRIFDAGCGYGRNLVYLLQAGYEVFGADANSEAVTAVQDLARTFAPEFPVRNFRTEQLERLSFPEAFADVVISNAVLHFSRDDKHFEAMLYGSWRVLRPGGLFFCRLASNVGMQHQQVSGRRFVSPDGEERYLVDEPLLMQYTQRLGGTLIDPLKTTVIQNMRCMTTWVIRKH